MALKLINRVNIAEQAFSQLKDQILSGTWQEGEKLPSEQELTEALGVSRSTIRQAIRSLADYGMVETRNGSGTYVKRQISGNYMLNIVPLSDLQTEDIVEILEFLCLMYLSVKYSMPLWIVKMWHSQLGIECSRCARACR